MGKWIKIIKRFLVDSVFERIREYAHQIVWPITGGMIMEHYNPSLTTVVLASLLFITICIKWWWKPKAKQAGVDVAAAETNTWISKADAEHLILQSRVITRIKAKHERPRGYYSELESVIRWANEQRHGPDAREVYEKKEIEDAIKHCLMVIEENYPQAINEEGEYSREIVERALLKMPSDE